ncbi:MAG: Crp/Fnr family transcriptional regulator [Agathobacter sp.]
MNVDTLVTKLQYWDFLTEEEKNILIQGTSYRSYQRNEYIHGFSDACLGMIYVQKGSIRVYMTSEEGREVTLFHIAEGDSCILSASCVIGEISLEVQLVAEEDTDIVAVHAGCFQQLMERNIQVKCFAYEMSTRRFSTVVWVMQQILFAHFDERMARLLLSIYEKTGEPKIKMTQEAMAQEVNSAREVVARMLKTFATEGWIEIDRGVITLKDIEALEELIK